MLNLPFYWNDLNAFFSSVERPTFTALLNKIEASSLIALSRPSSATMRRISAAEGPSRVEESCRSFKSLSTERFNFSCGFFPFFSFDCFFLSFAFLFSCFSFLESSAKSFDFALSVSFFLAFLAFSCLSFLPSFFSPLFLSFFACFYFLSFLPPFRRFLTSELLTLSFCESRELRLLEELEDEEEEEDDEDDDEELLLEESESLLLLALRRFFVCFLSFLDFLPFFCLFCFLSLPFLCDYSWSLNSP